MTADATTWEQWVWFGIYSGGCGVLILAALLQPSPTGLGTHQQLGLPPCGFQWLTELPCPSCGLTTSFSYFVRGNWLRCIAANPLGLPLALVTMLLTAVAAVAFVFRWRLWAMLRRYKPEKWFAILGVSAVLNWIVRVVSIF